MNTGANDVAAIGRFVEADLRAVPGGVKRPPFTDDEPCLATSVPMKM